VFLGGQVLAVLGVYQVSWLDMPEHFLLAKLAFQQHLGQNKHAVVHVGVVVVVVAYVAQAYFSLHVLKHTKAFENIINVLIIILVFFD
jgi:hypothetical protein